MNETPDPALSGPGRAMPGGSSPSGSNPSGPWLPPTPEELAALLDGYEVLKMLGRGGMGAVYMGRQTALDRPVAIKILSGALEDSDLGFKERFQNEARAMAKLSHPGIVAVHDFGETDRRLLFIVMEYIDGTDVARMIAAEGRLHSDHALAITAQVCDALAYAHERGIVHRDIKPANIMVDYEGIVKIADFGLAKVRCDGATLGLTLSGVAMGTMHYIAPEALQSGTPVDHRADIYAVGVMLYQMLTGKLPQGMFRLPSLQVPGLDPRYDGIVAKGIMENPVARYQDIREMRMALDGIRTQPVPRLDEAQTQAMTALPTPARPQRPVGKAAKRTPSANSQAQQSVPAKAKPRGWVVWIAAGLLVAGGGGGWWKWRNDRITAERSVVTPPPENRGSPTAPMSASNGAAPSPFANTPTTDDPAKATRDRPFLNTLGMAFVPVPGTRVLMCVHETRWKDFAVYASDFPDSRNRWAAQTHDGFELTDRAQDHPVVYVSWQDAHGFCDWLSQREYRTFRLPSDREWSIAVGLADKEVWKPGDTPRTVARVPDEYPWGREWPPRPGTGNYSDESRRSLAPAIDAKYITGYDDGFPTTAPVMSFPPNVLGFYDLGGNAWEWVLDPDETKPKWRFWRGEPWVGSESHRIFSSHRGSATANYRDHRSGFRCALEVDPPTGSGNL